MHIAPELSTMRWAVTFEAVRIFSGRQLKWKMRVCTTSITQHSMYQHHLRTLTLEWTQSEYLLMQICSHLFFFFSCNPSYPHLPKKKKKIFFFKGQLWHYESHLSETYIHCDIFPSCIKINFLSLSPSGNRSLGQAWIPKEKEVENEVIPPRKALNTKLKITKDNDVYGKSDTYVKYCAQVLKLSSAKKRKKKKTTQISSILESLQQMLSSIKLILENHAIKLQNYKTKPK